MGRVLQIVVANDFVQSCLVFRLFICAEEILDVSSIAGAQNSTWLRDLPFYDRVSLNAIFHLHNHGLGLAPFPVTPPPFLLGKWCPKPSHILNGLTKSGAVVPLRTGHDIGLVVMTAPQYETGRLQPIRRTWARHFANITFASSINHAHTHDVVVDRVVPPSEFSQHFSEDSYLSHVYKGHTGLSHVFQRYPSLPWFALVSDDSYVYAPFLTEVLQLASAQPEQDAVCVGHLQRQPKVVHWAIIKEMFRRCETVGRSLGLVWIEQCKEKAGQLRLPFVGVTYAHGAGIFCSNAAVALLAPYLETILSAGVFEQHGALFADFIRPSDELLGRCASELEIRLVDMHRYFAGSRLPGNFANAAPQLAEFREHLPPMRLAEALRPALWHEVRTPMDFDAIAYIYSVIEEAVSSPPSSLQLEGNFKTK